MTRSIGTLRTLVMLLVGADFAACDSQPSPSSGDLGMKPDMRMMPTMDMLMPAVDIDWRGGQTGANCTMAGECAKSLKGANKNAATCRKSSTFQAMPILWTGGFCTSACSDATNDKMTRQNAACPSDNAATCLNGQCELLCADALIDCKDGYVCVTVQIGVAICLPLAVSACNPLNDPRPGNKKCGLGETCVSYSPDRTYGECATLCDPVAQMCPPPMMGQSGCLLDYELMNGEGTCMGVASGAEGSVCMFQNGCSAGMECFAQKCRQYCRTGANPLPCPMGQTCKDIPVSGFNSQVLGICSP